MKKTLKELKNTKKPFEVIDSKDYTNLIDSISSSLKIVDTSTNFTTNNPILAVGQTGYEIDTKKEKVGDGVTAWNDLEYKESGGSIINYSTDEQVVGTWIDGKPIYRRVIDLYIYLEKQYSIVNISLASLNLENVDMLITSKPLFNYAGEFIHADLQITNNEGMSIRINAVDNTLEMDGFEVAENIYTYLIVEYTKTTD